MAPVRGRRGPGPLVMLAAGATPAGPAFRPAAIGAVVPARRYLSGGLIGRVAGWAGG